MKNITLVLVAVLFLSVALEAKVARRPAVVMNSLKGQIYAVKRTIPLAKVKLYRLRGPSGNPWRVRNAEYSTVSTQYGEFSFGALKPGRYEIEIDSGKMKWHQEIIVLAGPSNVITDVLVHVIEEYGPGMTSEWDIGRFSFSIYEQVN